MSLIRGKSPCYPKKRFANLTAAMAAAGRIANTQGVRRYAEGCPKCNGWHLSQPEVRNGN